MIATVTTSTASARTTRRSTWRSGVTSRWARCTPLCGSASARSWGATSRRVTAATWPPGSGRPGRRPFPRGQLPLEHLARGRHRDRLDEDDVAQPLVVHDLLIDRG